MKIRLWLALGMTFLFFLSSCNDEEVISNNQLVRSISVTGQDFVDGDGIVATRASYSVDVTGFHFTWTQGDTVGIYPVGGDQVAFPISSGEGSQTAQFDGGAWALRSSYSYAAYYPFSSGNYHIKETSIPVSYIGQFQNGNGSLDGFDKYDYQSSVATSPDADGNVFIALKHLGCFVRLQMEMPVADSYSLLSLCLDKGSFITEGTVDLSSNNPSITSTNSSNKYNVSLSNISATDDNKIITIYLMLAPSDFSESTITATLSGTKYATYSASFTGKNMEAGKAYSYSVKTNKGTTIGGEDIEWGDNGFILASSVTIDKTNVTLLPGAEIEVKATVLPEATTDKTIQWSSNDTLIASVINGIIIAKAPGTTMITASSMDGSNKFVSCTVEVKEPTYVDLGLPSGTLWASCNVGASIPEERGYCYSWGGKIKAGFEGYKPVYYDGNNYTKYNETDNIQVLEPFDDVATCLWGDDWQIPSHNQLKELLNSSYTSIVFTTQNGVEGYKIISKDNGNSVFFACYSERQYSVELYSNELRSNYGSSEAYGVHIYMDNNNMKFVRDGSLTRDFAFTIRPVRRKAINKHEYVDLGLSVKWATCNVGAISPYEYGDYYTWGDTTTYYEPDYAQSTSPVWKNSKSSGYNWSTYKYCNGSDFTLIKYCSDSSYGNNGFTDTLTTLIPEDDVAHMKWGGGWRMPTQADFNDLLNNCDWAWTTQNGVKGYKVTSRDDSSCFIFLPAAGYRDDINLYCVSYGNYLSSSLNTDYPSHAWYLYFDSYNHNMNRFIRYCGLSVRPVCP